MNIDRNKYLSVANCQAMKAGYDCGRVYGASSLPLFI